MEGKVVEGETVGWWGDGVIGWWDGGVVGRRRVAGGGVEGIRQPCMLSLTLLSKPQPLCTGPLLIYQTSSCLTLILLIAPHLVINAPVMVRVVLLAWFIVYHLQQFSVVPRVEQRLVDLQQVGWWAVGVVRHEMRGVVMRMVGG